MTTSVARRALLTATIDPPHTISTVEIKEVTLPSRFAVGWHLHPCPVVGVIKAGLIAFQIEDGAVQHLRSGDVFYEPANTCVAHFDNEGDTPATFTVFYLLIENQHELIRMLPH